MYLKRKLRRARSDKTDLGHFEAKIRRCGVIAGTAGWTLGGELSDGFLENLRVCIEIFARDEKKA